MLWLPVISLLASRSTWAVRRLSFKAPGLILYAREAWNGGIAGADLHARSLICLSADAQAGGVLEESARIALSWIRAHSAELGLPANGDAASEGGAEGRQASHAATDPSCWDVHGMRCIHNGLPSPLLCSCLH